MAVPYERTTRAIGEQDATHYAAQEPRSSGMRCAPAGRVVLCNHTNEQ
jgi:hypothetical protein